MRQSHETQDCPTVKSKSVCSRSSCMTVLSHCRTAVVRQCLICCLHTAPGCVSYCCSQLFNFVYRISLNNHDTGGFSGFIGGTSMKNSRARLESAKQLSSMPLKLNQSRPNMAVPVRQSVAREKGVNTCRRL